MMHRVLKVTFVAVLAALAGPASAGLIVYGSHSDHSLIPGASLADVQLLVDLEVAGGKATMTFTNASKAPETSAVFKEIVIDTFDDDTNTKIFWNAAILTNTKDVSYSFGKSNGLPGYHDLTSDATPLVTLQANSSPVKKGIGPGEVLKVSFCTSLANGSTMDDYLATLGGGNDTAAGAIGFHAISASVIRGESLSGITPGQTVPEPATAALLGLGAVGLARRRKRRVA